MIVNYFIHNTDKSKYITLFYIDRLINLINNHNYHFYDI